VCKSLSGKGLERIDSTKTEAARRTIQLPWFAVETLRARRGRPYLGQQAVIFTSMAGTLLAMSEGQSAIADRSQMDGVVLATLHEKQVAVTRLRSASFRSRFSVQNKDELRAAVEALPACTQKTTAPQKELLTVAAVILPK
jgi:hypothetical protein